MIVMNASGSSISTVWITCGTSRRHSGPCAGGEASPRDRVTDLVTLLNAFVRSNDLDQVFAGPIDVLFGEGDYLEPDLVFVQKGRTDLLSDRGIEGPPDLVVEVASPSTADRDRGKKLERYRVFGVAEYWVVDPDAGSVEVWNLAGGTEKALVLGPNDTLRWRPTERAPAELELHVGEVIPAGR